jgi:bifunctional non-homologous end joining protein LigD
LPFNVMLANSAPANDNTIATLMTEQGEWYFDLKIDGVRCVMAINNGKVTLTNRNGVDITYRYPEVAAAALEKFGTDARLILDGECVVFDENGKPSFKLTSKRDRQQKAHVIQGLSTSMPATFVAFDVLYHDGKDTRDEIYHFRKALLDTLMMDRTQPHLRIIANVGSHDGHKMLALVREHSLEGLIAKRMKSRYQAGRRSDWLKIKPTQTVSCIVTGASLGTGARNSTFGALALELVKDGQRVSVGDVGTGFKQADLQEILSTYFHADTGVRGTPVVHTEFVVEVEFQEMTVDGKLRFPVFRGIRTDVGIDECYYEQVQQHQIQELTL